MTLFVFLIFHFLVKNICIYYLLLVILQKHISSMIKTIQEVEHFISHFKAKMKIFGILFTERGKNSEALRMLGITNNERIKVVERIETSDYIETISDELSFGDMWVFGKDAFGVELYIKISLGHPNSNTICISFHIADYPLDYKYKNGQKS